MSLPDHVTFPPDVLEREIDGKLVLLSMSAGTYFELNEVGTRIWAELRKDGDVARVRSWLHATYPQREPTTLDADLTTFLGELRREHLLVG